MEFYDIKLCKFFKKSYFNSWNLYCLVLNRNRAFFFCDLVSWFFLTFLVVSRIFLVIKVETICGFMKLGKKISWNLEGFGGGFMKLDKKISWNLEGFGGFMKRWRPRSIGAKRRSTGRHRFMNTTKTLQVSTFFLSSFMNTNTKTLQV